MESGRILTEVFHPSEPGGFGINSNGAIVRTAAINSNDYGGIADIYLPASGGNIKIDLGELRGQLGNGFPGQTIQTVVNSGGQYKNIGQSITKEESISVVQGKGFRNLSLRFSGPVDNEQINTLKLTIIKEKHKVRITSNVGRLGAIGVIKKDYPRPESNEGQFLVNDELAISFDATLAPELPKSFTVQAEFMSI